MKATRSVLLRDLPVGLVEKVKVAAGLHGQSMQGYIETVLTDHVKSLEKKGVTLSLKRG